MSHSASLQEIVQEHRVRASAHTVYSALVHRLTDGMDGEGGAPMALALEARPGGRWFRDLGDNAGHLWAFVQSVKPGALLEMTGPLWMSGPVSNHLIIRFKEEDGTTIITFKHTAHGFLDPSFLEGTEEGWNAIFDDIREAAEA